MSSALRMVSDRKPVSLREDAGYAKAEDRLQDLQGSANDLEQRRRRLYSDFTAAGSGSDLDRRAAALLESGKTVESGEEQRQRLRVTMGELTDQLQVALRAVDMQKVVLEREKRRAAATIQARLAPEYRALIQGLYRAMVALSDACRAEEQFRLAVVDGGVPLGSSLHPMPFMGDAVRLDLEHSNANIWAKEAREFGLL